MKFKAMLAISLKPEISAFVETSIFSESDSGLSGITLLCYFTAMCSACKVQTINFYFFFIKILIFLFKTILFSKSFQTYHPVYVTTGLLTVLYLFLKQKVRGKKKEFLSLSI